MVVVLVVMVVAVPLAWVGAAVEVAAAVVAVGRRLKCDALCCTIIQVRLLLLYHARIYASKYAPLVMIPNVPFVQQYVLVLMCMY